MTEHVLIPNEMPDTVRHEIAMLICSGGRNIAADIYRKVVESGIPATDRPVMESAAFVTEPVDDGGPAFPAKVGSVYTGLTKREWFAGQALAGMADPNSVPTSPARAKGIAHSCYLMADAMLAMLAEGRK